MSERVALIGAGAMGGAIGARLVETGNTLTVFDLDQDKVAALVAKGAGSAGSAAAAASASDYIITSLNSPQIVELAVFGPQGVADGAKPGALIIDMSSIDPDATKAARGPSGQNGLALGRQPVVRRRAEGANRRTDAHGGRRGRRMSPTPTTC